MKAAVVPPAPPHMLHRCSPLCALSGQDVGFRSCFHGPGFCLRTALKAALVDLALCVFIVCLLLFLYLRSPPLYWHLVNSPSFCQTLERLEKYHKRLG